jgi:Ca2+-binding RTX toxin-like protein
LASGEFVPINSKGRTTTVVTRITNDDATFVASTENETFLVEAETELVFLNSSFGIVGSDAAGGRTFRIDGTVNAAKDPAIAISVDCSATSVERIIVGSSGVVTATFGAIKAFGGLVDVRISGEVESAGVAVSLSGDVAKMRNSGTVEGGDAASSAVKLLADHSTMTNSGEINSFDGNAIIVFGDSTTMVNSGSIQTVAQGLAAIDVGSGTLDFTNSGTVTSENGSAMFLHGGALGVGNTTIRNDGTIIGENVAIKANSAPSSDTFAIINTGDIIGDIDLSRSARNDRVDTSNGRVEGDVLTGAGNDRIVLIGADITGGVSGGEGDDTYTISSAVISLAEDVDGGTDTVRAIGNVSVILADNFENVVLVGSNDTQATGNSAHNRMTGNAGNNFIEGAGGEDTIRGGRGRDELIGGGDADTFIFRKGDHKDLIGDFDTGSGHDFLDLSNIKGIADFDDLRDDHARNVDGDVVINAGNGDRVVLEGVSVADLSAEMFFL